MGHVMGQRKMSLSFHSHGSELGNIPTQRNNYYFQAAPILMQDIAIVN